MIVALEAVAGTNRFSQQVVNNIKEKVSALIEGDLKVLQEEGYVILPHFEPYGRLKISEPDRIIYLDPGLFEWDPLLSLQKFGQKVDAGAVRFFRTVRGVKHVLPLLVLPFEKTILDKYTDFDFKKYDWETAPPLPIVATSDFIALPQEWMARFLYLSNRYLKGELSENEDIEFRVWAQQIKVLSDPKR